MLYQQFNAEEITSETRCLTTILRSNSAQNDRRSIKKGQQEIEYDSMVFDEELALHDGMISY